MTQRNIQASRRARDRSGSAALALVAPPRAHSAASLFQATRTLQATTARRGDAHRAFQMYFPRRLPAEHLPRAAAAAAHGVASSDSDAAAAALHRMDQAYLPTSIPDHARKTRTLYPSPCSSTQNPQPSTTTSTNPFVFSRHHSLLNHLGSNMNTLHQLPTLAPPSL